MSKKVASIILYMLFIVIGFFYFISTLYFPSSADGGVIGPAYYPRILSVLIIIFSLIGLHRDIIGKDKDDKEIIPIHIKRFFFIIILMVIIGLMWQLFDIFYFVTVICFFVAIYFLNEKSHSIKRFLFSLGISVIFVVGIYIVFEELLGIPL